MYLCTLGMGARPVGNKVLYEQWFDIAPQYYGIIKY
jgi:hypothetical protein